MEIDRAGLAEFLLRRREALQPEDVGLSRGPRRRTRGLRREEVAALSHMSTDYYARLERATGPHPSEQMIAALAQGLYLSVAERDHLFRLAGHHPPTSGASGEHVGPGLLRILDRLADTPAEVMTELGETLRQTPLGRALMGDATRYVGPDRSLGYRWFAAPESRALYAPEEHAYLSRLFASGLRELRTRRGPGSRAAQMTDDLLRRSAEFRETWDRHEVGLRPRASKVFMHPELGRIELACQTLTDPEQSHSLMVYTAEPGSESAEKLRMLAVIGSSTF